ncbi:hypothetical protein TREMEDRAFT_32709 [Tremella mesenterica DSM 1558]|uniref:uncharacterized protein n=1 Tax=Tremella mesenterica (strain ATCC 24925 / CBS 8224 / DSM 1558 / NBRC 9311 / NRRL Y-6157 / RJB 2259-6 / UBC 559-6) TaxID=578456 RepID=UPI0003F48CC3|nr:uncharacterized protein TREMEDRAFT_32709 [Tremella mesenterica DSM 1558]EIW67938.1 hypothetical protein TREMEDRAFT_32709 [Tremella mesenterica DSM 1558]
MTKDQPDFSDLEYFNDARFQPPAWAQEHFPIAGRNGWKNGESSKTPLASGSGELKDPPGLPRDEDKRHQTNDDTLKDEEDEENGVEDDEEVWEDAREEVDVDPDNAEFTTEQLSDLLNKAITHKNRGNTHFTSHPPAHQSALEAYTAALDLLPSVPPPPSRKGKSPEVDIGPIQDGADSMDNTGGAKIHEVDEVEADMIEREAHEGVEMREKREKERREKKDREDVEKDIRECTKACWGNKAACYIALNDDKAAVEACTKALEIDPTYLKALQRRAGANERIGSWSSLTSAQEDYTQLISLLPLNSPLLPAIRKSLARLPESIRLQQEKEKDEMLSKLKELGNGILGKFGMSTDMFKFEQQPGGGYNLSFGK